MSNIGGKSIIERFKPRVSLGELEYAIGDRNPEINDDDLYASAKELLSAAVPSHEDPYERRWEYFLLPLRRAGKVIVLTFSVVEYRERFYFHFPRLGGFSIGPGSGRKDPAFNEILNDALRFARLSRTVDPNALIAKIPYDFRFGGIKGKYVLARLMPPREKARLAASYRDHQAKKIKLPSVSLNEYLDAAALCYRAAFGAKTRRRSPLEMYKKWADGRDGGMLSIKNPKSRRAFGAWHRGGQWTGAHPFELVFSMIDHGIHLFPPSKNRPRFTIEITNFGYVLYYVKMVRTLIRSGVAFEAEQFAFVLDYLAGETDFEVNDYGDHSFQYTPSREDKQRYFRHIEWEIPRLVEFK